MKLSAAAAAATGGISVLGQEHARAADPAVQTRPNILFLFSDQHHPHVLSPAGHPLVKTPHLQRMADEGVCFASAYCSSPLCVPSRTSTLLSRCNHATGIFGNVYDDVVGDQPNVPRSLQAAGYHTCHIGKTHLGTATSSRERLQRLGFSESFPTAGKNGVVGAKAGGAYVEYLRSKGVYDKFNADYLARIADRENTLCDARPSVLDVEDYFDQWTSRRADDWLRSYKGDVPFYLSVNWPGPHALRDAPGRYATMYDPARIDRPIEDPMTLAPEPIKRRQAETLAKLTGEAWRDVRASYYGMISLIDDGIGMMLRTLEERGLLDNTIVIYSSDHGEMLWDHGMVYKTILYESSAGVPLIIRYPKAFAQKLRPKSPVSLVDLGPTLLEVAGASPLPGAHGRSLVPILSGKADDRTEVFSEFEQSRMVRRGGWKYICDPSWDVQQLFNLDEDPQEIDNLVHKAPEIAREMHARIEAWLEETKI